jgi:hypothetical protein
MFPGPKITTSGQQLSRLAEIAEAVSMHQRAVHQHVLPSDSVFSVAQLMAQNQPASFASALRRRSAEDNEHYFSGDQRPTTGASPPTKRQKVDNSTDADDGDEDDKDVRFREYQAEIWSEKFEDLCEFRRQYGHCHVPHSFEENSPL